MSDVDTRLCESLATVAETTRASSRVEEIVDGRSRSSGRQFPAALAGLAAFVIVLLAVGLPILLNLGGEQGPAVEPPTETVATDPPSSSVTPPPTVDEDEEAPVGEDDEWAVDPAWFVFDGADLAFFNQMPERYYLGSEAVLCLYRGVDGIGSRASSFPIGDDLTVADLESTCLQADPVHGLEAPPSDFTVCRGVHGEAYYDDLLASGAVTLERPDNWTPPGTMVVLGWESDCVSEVFEAPVALTLYDDLSLETVNQVRRMEMATTAAWMQNCFTFEEAKTVSAEAARLLGDGWIVGEFDPARLEGIDGVCYELMFDPGFGAILVIGNIRTP